MFILIHNNAIILYDGNWHVTGIISKPSKPPDFSFYTEHALIQWNYSLSIYTWLSIPTNESIGTLHK